MRYQALLACMTDKAFRLLSAWKHVLLPPSNNSTITSSGVIFPSPKLKGGVRRNASSFAVGNNRIVERRIMRHISAYCVLCTCVMCRRLCMAKCSHSRRSTDRINDDSFVRWINHQRQRLTCLGQRDDSASVQQSLTFSKASFTAAHSWVFNQSKECLPWEVTNPASFFFFTIHMIEEYQLPPDTHVLFLNAAFTHLHLLTNVVSLLHRQGCVTHPLTASNIGVLRIKLLQHN